MSKIIRAYPKIFLVPFLAMVLFFSIIVFVVLTAPVHFTGFTVLGSEYSFFRVSSLYLWLLSVLVGVPIAFFYLAKLYDNTKKTKKSRKKEEAGVVDLLMVFAMGLPFGFFIGGFLLLPSSVFFTVNGMLWVFSLPILFSVLVLALTQFFGKK